MASVTMKTILMPIILHIIYDIVYSLSKNNTDACVDGCLPRLTQMLFRAIVPYSELLMKISCRKGITIQ